MAGPAAYDLNVFFGADPFAQQFWNQGPVSGPLVAPPMAPAVAPPMAVPVPAPVLGAPAPAPAPSPAGAQQNAQVLLEPGLRPIPPVVPPAVPVEVRTERAAAAPAPVGSGRWYMAGGIGIVSFPSAANSGSGVDHSVDFDSGTLVRGALGVAWRPNINLEAELAYRQASAATVTPAGGAAVTATGSRTVWSLMANGVYGFQTGWPLTPYVLAGAGLATIQADNIDAAGIDASDSSATAFAYQFGFGADFPLSPRWSVDTSYRYFATTKPELKDAAGRTYKSEVAAHNVEVGARVRF